RPADDPFVAVAHRAGDHPAGVRARLRLAQRERRRPLAGGAAGQEAVLELLGPEQLDRQGTQLLDHQHERAAGAHLGDLLDRHVEHQRARAGAAVLLVEGQAEQVMLGEELADVLRVLGLLVDLRRPGRHALLGHLADGLAEVEVLLGDRVGVGESFHGPRHATQAGSTAYRASGLPRTQPNWLPPRRKTQVLTRVSVTVPFQVTTWETVAPSSLRLVALRYATG